MKKIINLILILSFLTANPLPTFCNVHRCEIYKSGLKDIQTKTYNDIPPEVVKKAILNIFQKNEYKISYENDDLNYTTASKNVNVRDVNPKLLLLYMGKIVFDTFGAIVTYGARSYSVVNDIILIKVEFKEKNLENKIAVNISPTGNSSTTIRINMTDILTGKRDGFFFGPKNRLKTTNITDADIYDSFFAQLDRELQLPDYQKASQKPLK